MDNDNLGGEKALLEERRKKLDQLRDKGSAYGNTFKPQNSAKKLHEEFGQFSKEELVKKDIKNIFEYLYNHFLAWVAQILANIRNVTIAVEYESLIFLSSGFLLLSPWQYASKLKAIGI